MRVAFLIQAHKSYRQIKKIINYLDENNCDIYLHIDLKAEDLYKKLFKDKILYKNLYIIEKRYNVNWSGFSQINATLEMMKQASLKNYDYVSLISGQDLLIKPINEFVEFLKKNQGKEFIEYEEIKNKKWRLKKYSFFTESPNNRKLAYKIIDNIIRKIQIKVFERKNFKNFKELYSGSQWFTITGSAVNYILEIIKSEKIIKDFQYTACSDEHFFQIILLNSKFKNQCINNNLRYIDWSECKNSPRTLTEEDFSKLELSNCFIARKFDFSIDEKIIEKIYKKLLKE